MIMHHHYMVSGHGTGGSHVRCQSDNGIAANYADLKTNTMAANALNAAVDSGRLTGRHDSSWAIREVLIAAGLSVDPIAPRPWLTRP